MTLRVTSSPIRSKCKGRWGRDAFDRRLREAADPMMAAIESARAHSRSSVRATPSSQRTIQKDHFNADITSNHTGHRSTASAWANSFDAGANEAQVQRSWMRSEATPAVDFASACRRSIISTMVSTVGRSAWKGLRRFQCRVMCTATIRKSRHRCTAISSTVVI